MTLRFVGCALSLCLAAVPAAAQAPASQAPVPASDLVAPPSWAYTPIACAPSLVIVKPGEKPVTPALRVIGAQDSANRDLMGPGDTLVVSGGSDAGMQVGQRYFVRRHMTTLGGAVAVPKTVHTAGWLQILGVDTMLATATLVQACGDGVLLDDYLEPFVAPMIAARPLPGTTPHYDNMGHIMTGIEGVMTGATGQVMTIDLGSNSGVALGQRFVVFRDKRNDRVEITNRTKVFAESLGKQPLVQIGEILVVQVRPDDSSVQIVASTDAISTGDLIAPIR
jgi:hypothetical protein